METEKLVIELLSTDIEDVAEEFAKIVVATSREHPALRDLDRLRGYLQRHPEISGVLGDLCQELTERLLDYYSNVPAKRESVAAFCQRMRADLGYIKTSMLEKSLIDHIVNCWLALHQVSTMHQSVLERGQDSATTYWEKRVDAAQRRYLRAVESLMRVRRLASRAPLVQVSITKQAIFAGGNSSAPVTPSHNS
jgi:hypothetical protein